MGVVSRPSQIILLVEDNLHQQFIFKYIRTLGYERHAIRVVKAPSGAGSAEQWIRDRFASEIEACRRRHAETKLVVLIDADAYTVQQRLGQLNKKLRDVGAAMVPSDTKQVAFLVPRRNIETWLLCLNRVPVDEETDYKRTRNDWAELVGTAVITLCEWSGPNAAVPLLCVESLRIGIHELQRLKL